MTDKKERPISRICVAVLVVCTTLPLTTRAQEPSGEKAWTKYFPAKVFHANPTANDSQAEWYGRDLAELSEPSLFDLRTDSKALVYRLLWVPSFSTPVSIRMIVKGDGTGEVVVKRLIQATEGLQVKKVVKSDHIAVSLREVNLILNEVETAGFWQLPTEEENTFTADGDECVLEGVSKGNYHIVDRTSPEPYTPYGHLCSSFLELAHIESAGSRWSEMSGNSM